MADSPNVLRKGPAPIVKTAADGAVVPGQIRIKGFRLTTTPAAVGACTVTDDLGNVIFRGVTTTTQGTDAFTIPYQEGMNLPGYQCTAISGTNAVLDIYAD